MCSSDLDAFDNQIASICTTCATEYNAFLRYSLFYGMYFLSQNKEIKLSYIKELGDTEANPYSIFSNIMGLEVEEYKLSRSDVPWEELMVFESDLPIHVKAPTEGTEKRSMETCFSRYLWNHCLDKDTFYYDAFQLERCTKFFIEYNYLDKVAEPQDESIDTRQFESYTKRFPFLDDADKQEIQNSIKKKLVEKEPRKRKHSKEYIDNSMEFGYRKWTDFKQTTGQVNTAFNQWLLNGTEVIEWNKQCKNCNQRSICKFKEADE